MAKRDDVYRNNSLLPPAKGRGLVRLRAAPGAEAVRHAVVTEQQAALAAQQAAPHYRLRRLRPVRPGAKVAVVGHVPAGELATVKLTHVRYGLHSYGHVVQWRGNDYQWVPDTDVEVMP